jgi:hypothetical protein
MPAKKATSAKKTAKKSAKKKSSDPPAPSAISKKKEFSVLYKMERKTVKTVNISEGKTYNYLLTLGKTKDGYFKNTPEENQSVYDTVDSFCKVKYGHDLAIIQSEQYKPEPDQPEDVIKWHYHIVLLYKNARYATGPMNIANDLLQKFPWSDIQLKQADKPYGCIGYLYKDRHINEPVVIGELTEDMIGTALALRERSRDAAIPTTKAGYAEQSKDAIMIYKVKEWMIKNGVSVNYHTRELRGITQKKLMQRLETDLEITSRYGMSAPTQIRKYIEDDAYYVLPVWEPDLDYISFADCNYRISTGTRLPKEKDITPFYETEQPFPGIYPEDWIGCITANNFPIEDFISSFSHFYRPKKRREKILYLCGDSGTGKSTLIEPYAELYSGIACYVSEEDKFTFSHIIRYPKIIINEFDPYSIGIGINQFKNLAEGAPFNVPVKNKGQQQVGAKNVIITSNTNIASKDYTAVHDDRDSKALRNRMDIYETLSNGIIVPDSCVIERIALEAAAICVLCTQSEEYIKLKTKPKKAKTAKPKTKKQPKKCDK